MTRSQQIVYPDPELDKKKITVQYTFSDTSSKVSKMTNLAIFVIFISLAVISEAAARRNTSAPVSQRKGVCIAPEYYQCSDLSGFTGASWYYNWGTQPSPLGHPECDGVPVPESPEFVPMIWGWYGQQLPPLPDYDTVLGFNEPNHASQANLSPEEAALGWMELQAAYPDKTLVSPSASPPNTEEWFDEFFEICEALGCRVDYIGTVLKSFNISR